MLAEILIEGKPHRFRISWLSRPEGITPMDIELTDISEDPSTLYEGKRIDYYKWKEAIKQNKVKIIM
jgi:hypothetical protein